MREAAHERGPGVAGGEQEEDLLRHAPAVLAGHGDCRIIRPGRPRRGHRRVRRRLRGPLRKVPVSATSTHGSRVRSCIQASDRPDLLDEVSARLRARGVRTIAYYSVSWDERFADEKPDWLAESATGVRGNGPVRWRTLCINGPYADVVERHLADIARKGVGRHLAGHDDRRGRLLLLPAVPSRFQSSARAAAALIARGAGLHGVPRVPLRDRGIVLRADAASAARGRARRGLHEQLLGIPVVLGRDGKPCGRGDLQRGLPHGRGLLGLDRASARRRSCPSSCAVSPRAGRSNPWSGRTSTCGTSRASRGHISPTRLSRSSRTAPLSRWTTSRCIPGGSTRACTGKTCGRSSLRSRRMSKTVKGRQARYVSVYHSQRAKDRCADQRDFVRDICGAFRLFRDLRLPVDFTFDEMHAVPDPVEVPVLALSGATELTRGRMGPPCRLRAGGRPGRGGWRDRRRQRGRRGARSTRSAGGNAFGIFGLLPSQPGRRTRHPGARQVRRDLGGTRRPW